jgi:hypothetical protein
VWHFIALLNKYAELENFQGIGITAFLLHADVYGQINFNYKLHYAVRSAEDIPFQPLIAKLGSNVIIYDKSKGERMNVHQILKERSWNSFVYRYAPELSL